MLVMGIINLRKRKMLNGAPHEREDLHHRFVREYDHPGPYPQRVLRGLEPLVSLCVLAMLLSFADYFMAYFLGSIKSTRYLTSRGLPTERIVDGPGILWQYSVEGVSALLPNEHNKHDNPELKKG